MNVPKSHYPPKLLTSAQAAEVLGTTVQAVQARCARRQLPHVKVGRRLMFDPDELAAWIDARRVAEVTP